ncbi:MAG: methyltransferase domain-containing protein [Crocinitomicaceae bacterium]
MDNFELSGNDLDKTLIGLTSINKTLGNTASTLKAVKKELLKITKSVKIVDLGCGGGDNLRAIENWCHKNNRPIELFGIDANPHIIEYARQQNNSSLNINYLKADILVDDFKLPTCDILISSHFMYHFSDDQMVEFLKKSKPNVSSTIIFSELQRNCFAYLLFKIGSFFLPFSKIVKEDGLLAIRRAFTKKELINILERAEFSNYNISWKWAFRFLVVISVKD